MSSNKGTNEIDFPAFMKIFNEMKSSKEESRLRDELEETRLQLRIAQQAIEDLTLENNWLHSFLYEGPISNPSSADQQKSVTKPKKQGKRVQAKLELEETPKTGNPRTPKNLNGPKKSTRSRIN